jgi:hypothetical protein
MDANATTEKRGKALERRVFSDFRAVLATLSAPLRRLAGNDGAGVRNERVSHSTDTSDLEEKRAEGDARWGRKAFGGPVWCDGHRIRASRYARA